MCTNWILTWPQKRAEAVRRGRLQSAVASATYADRLQAVPFTANTQLLWYRTDRMSEPPSTWDELIEHAEQLGEKGTIQAQGERYEGLTVFFYLLCQAFRIQPCRPIMSNRGPKVATIPYGNLSGH
ncbi:MAG: extracellular solute-binding protein [Desulfobulbaceae bacterium]|nr:extracellular solute-binding protein [Desulfobulbaceae bacterium]